MYEVFYNLKAEPFRLSPDHKFCYEHKGYAKARAYMAYAFKRAEGFVMITGRPGTGKTTLVGELVESMSADSVETANLVCTQLQADDLLKTVAFAFGVGSSDLDKAELLQRLTTLFQRWHHEGRRALLIVDEAQDLSISAMEELRLLTNIQIGGQPLVQIFLLGQPELRDLIMAPEMEQVHQRVIAASHLRGLEVEETENYVVHRLLTSGWNGDPAIDRHIFPLVHKFSEGVPRRINLICSRLLLLGSVEERHAIEVGDVRAVIGELQAENLAAGTWLSEADFDFTREPDWLVVPGVTQEAPATSDSSDEVPEDVADTKAETAKKKAPPDLTQDASSESVDELPADSAVQALPVAKVLKAIPPVAAAVPAGGESLLVVGVTADAASHGAAGEAHSLDQSVAAVVMAPSLEEAPRAANENEDEFVYVSRDFLDGDDEGEDFEGESPTPGSVAEAAEAPSATDEVSTHLDEDAPGQQWPQTSRRESNVSSLMGEPQIVEDAVPEVAVQAVPVSSGSPRSKLRILIVVLILLTLIAATVFFLEILLSRNDDQVRDISLPTSAVQSTRAQETPPPESSSALAPKRDTGSEAALPSNREPIEDLEPRVETTPLGSDQSAAASSDQSVAAGSDQSAAASKVDSQELASSVSAETVSASSIEEEVEEPAVIEETPEAVAVIASAATDIKQTATKSKAPSLPVLKQVYEIGFSSGGANLLPDAIAVLNKAAEKMHDHPDSSATILAFSAQQGDLVIGDIYDRRRKGVQNYLVLAGINQSRLESSLDNASRGVAVAPGAGTAFVQVVVSRVLR